MKDADTVLHHRFPTVLAVVLVGANAAAVLVTVHRDCRRAVEGVDDVVLEDLDAVDSRKGGNPYLQQVVVDGELSLLEEYSTRSWWQLRSRRVAVAVDGRLPAMHMAVRVAERVIEIRKTSK